MHKQVESTQSHKTTISCVESLHHQGKIIIQTETVGNFSSHDLAWSSICLTREQAREFADNLIKLADELFFEEKRREA